MTSKLPFHEEIFSKVLYFEWALLIICAFSEGVVKVLAPPDPTTPNLLVSIVLLITVALLSFVSPRQHGYWDRLCFLLLELTLITGAAAAGQIRFVFPLFMVVIAKACLILDRRGLIIMSALALIAQFVNGSYKILLSRPDLRHADFNTQLVTLIFGSIVTMYVAITLMILVAVLTLTLIAEQRTRLEAERLSREVENLATELERTRIAREIHDSLGHTLTSLNIQLDVVRKLKERDPAKAMQSLELAKELARQLLTDVRLAVQSIRQADFDLSQAVEQLVADFKQHQHQIEIELSINIDSVPRAIGFQIYRVIQEGLTNVAKHANASKVSIALEGTRNQLSVIVRDNGRGMESATSTNGFGIRGIQERVETMGGEVKFEAGDNGGTKISVMVPIREEDISRGSVPALPEPESVKEGD
jgi:signal transduction histidine kinase